MITSINPMCLIDGYKADHRNQYPEGTELVYSNFTPRMSRVEGVNEVLCYGMQYFIKEYLIDRWNKGFFEKPKEVVVAEYKRRMDNYLGAGAITVEHIAELHDLGYLPIRIKAVPEGTLVPIGVPVFTIINTMHKFFWLTNYFESLMSNILWKPMTSATTAFQYRKRFEAFAELTGYDKGFIPWQGHDFSFRGMGGSEDSLLSSAGHLLSFTGTDTIPAIDFLEQYYNANSDLELIGGSVPATEHSVMCMGEEDNEIDTFRRLITKLYPNGIVSIVSDTWDFWKVVTEYLPELKEEILARNGRVVIRPDSGDPVKIICGIPYIETTLNLGQISREICSFSRAEYCEVAANNIEVAKIGGKFFKIEGNYKDGYEPKYEIPEAVVKGAYECLYDTFGGEVNALGYKVLNGKIGLIYGDSITLERQNQILTQLKAKGYSASNLVLGIGSYTYVYVTRDTFGFAMKATWGQVNGVAKNIFKNPKTDSGFKKSAKGLLKVYRDEDGVIKLKDQVSWDEEAEGILEVVFLDGKLMKETSLGEIRALVASQL